MVRTVVTKIEAAVYDEIHDAPTEYSMSHKKSMRYLLVGDFLDLSLRFEIK